MCQERGFNQACNCLWWATIVRGLEGAKPSNQHTHLFYDRTKLIESNAVENIKENLRAKNKGVGRVKRIYRNERNVYRFEDLK